MPNRHVTLDLELGVQSPLRLAAWRRADRRAPACTSRGKPFSSVPSTSVSVCRTSFSRGSRAMGSSCSPSSAMISFSRSGSKTCRGFAQRTERSPQAAELALHVAQFAGLLDGPQRTDHGIEQEQQHQHAVLVEVQLAVAGLVALAADVVQALQQRQRACRSTSSPSHPLRARRSRFSPAMPEIMRAHANGAIPLARGALECANLVPNRIGPDPFVSPSTNHPSADQASHRRQHDHAGRFGRRRQRAHRLVVVRQHLTQVQEVHGAVVIEVAVGPHAGLIVLRQQLAQIGEVRGAVQVGVAVQRVRHVDLAGPRVVEPSQATRGSGRRALELAGIPSASVIARGQQALDGRDRVGFAQVIEDEHAALDVGAAAA